MSTQKKYMGSSHFKNTAIAIAVASSFAMTPAWAADTATGSGNGVAYGTGSKPLRLRTLLSARMPPLLTLVELDSLPPVTL